MNSPSHLKRIVDRNFAEREADKLQYKSYKDRVDLIKSVEDSKEMEFWCNTCRKDFFATGVKVIASPTPSNPLPFAWYETRCPENHKAIRRITDKLNDPYFVYSQSVQWQRREFDDDLLQPSDPRFKYKYPEQWKELNKENI